MKKTAALVLMMMLCLLAQAALALDVTGLETDQNGRDWATSKFFARMEALTGVAATAHGVSDAAEYSAMLDAMAQGEVNTDVLFKANLTREQETALLDSGALIDLAPLIDAHMPNLSALLQSHPDWREIITLEDGRIASLPLLNAKERQVMVWINRAWLDQMKIGMPQNLDELTQALEKMTYTDLNFNVQQDEIAADLTGVYEMRWLLPYFGIVADDYHLARDADGQIVLAPEMPQYREFIALLADWYARGILKPQAFTGLHGDALYEHQEEDPPVTSGLFVSMTPYTHVPTSATTSYEPLLLAGPDGTTRWRDLLGAVWTGCFAVTSRCEDPAQALAWVDALYTEEGSALAYAGQEGEDYTVNEDGSWIFLTSDMRDIDDIQAESLMYTGACMPGLYPSDFVERLDSELDQHVFAANERVCAVSERVTQPYSLSAADQARADELAAAVTRLVDVGIARFATGEAELTDESYNAWLAEIKTAGGDELAALFQNVK